MLTRELLRCRVSGDVVTPIYLETAPGWKYGRLATEVLARYRAGVGGRLSDVQAGLADLPVAPADLVVLRGLAKIAEESAEIGPPAPIDASALRRAVFLLGAELGPAVRRDDPEFRAAAGERIAAIAAAFGITPEEVFSLLFADLKERRLLHAFNRALTPEALISRYNTALAQAMLYRATSLTVELADGTRRCSST